MKKITVTIGIPAYNEEKTIGDILSALEKQIEKNFVLEKIIVISDGSTDKTEDVVSAMKNKKISLISDKKRNGKNNRLNYLFAHCTSDLLVIIDADVAVADSLLISKMVSTYVQSSADVVAGNVIPLPSQTLVERGINNFVIALTNVKNKINKGDNIYSMRGPLYGLSPDICKHLSLPNNVPDDRYIYLFAKKNKYKTVFSKSATVYFRSPQTIEDQYKQGKRFISDKNNLYRHFDKELIETEYYLPFVSRLNLLSKQLFRDPISYLMLKFIHIRAISVPSEKTNNLWEKIHSSKNL